MATLANTLNRVVAQEMEAESRQAADEFRLRELPNERIHLFVKRIDNSRVVRAADPAGRTVCWKFIGGATLTVLLLVAVLLPSAYGTLAGFQLESLRTQKSQLEADLRLLEVEEARALSPERMEELARMQEYVDPAPGAVVHLPAKEAVAMNREGQ
jgi:hypothetical protein